MIDDKLWNQAITIYNAIIKMPSAILDGKCGRVKSREAVLFCIYNELEKQQKEMNGQT
jgi:hypothetical protein